MLLAALPLVALPIIIHLINQRRYQTIRWAAMMFLLAANRMSRGYARLRQWLIMAFRMAAIAALIFAVSRPLAGGWLGLTAGGLADTTIVLLDRSPSMQQVGPDIRGSKLDTGRRQLAQTLQTLGSARWALIESTTNQPRELDSAADLLTSPGTTPASASADLPAMLLSARDYLKANKAGRTEIWICSDLRANDWNPDSGRWQLVRDGLRELPQSVRLHLLAYPQPAPENLSVRVTDVRRRKTANGAELLLTLRIIGEGPSADRQSVPVQFEIDGARSEASVELVEGSAELKDYRIPLEKGRERGWGRVSIPADANASDDDFWFVFEQPVPRRAIVVIEDPPAASALELAAAVSPDRGVSHHAEVLTPSQIADVDWNQVSLLLWQAPLPEPEVGKQIEAFVDHGGSAIFFPARLPGSGELFGVHWTSWVKGKVGAGAVLTWRGDQDLLAHTQSGMPLPVGQLQVHKHCGIAGELTPLANLRDGAPLLGRVTTDRGSAYFCATTASGADSSLASDGVVFYVLVQRALTSGATALGSTQQLTAGPLGRRDATSWRRVAGGDDALSTDFSFHRGVYQAGDRLLAVNRAPGEAPAPILAGRRVDALFQGLDFARVDDRAGSTGSLIQEIWRLFLVSMMGAMIVEAALCLPRPALRAGGPE
jgi:hypothetical protein